MATIVVGTNSYSDLATADAYFLDSLRAAEWAGYAENTRNQGMIEATRVFERQVWDGEKETPSQTLAFGRTGLTDKEGVALTPAETLVTISEAQFEYAIVLIADPDILDDRDATSNNIKEVGAGSTKVVFFKTSTGTRFPLIIDDLVGDWFGGAKSSSAFGIVSGNCDSSSFTNSERNALCRGFK